MIILLEGFFALLSGVLLLTSGIENNNSFPHPLSPDKEKEYLDKFHSGDLTARDVLVKHNLRLIVYIAKKYTNYPDKDELISVGTIGLIKAINTYKGDKSTALATYASRCIENEILMAMRSYKKRQNDLSLYDEVGTDKDGNPIDSFNDDTGTDRKLPFVDGLMSRLYKRISTYQPEQHDPPKQNTIT